MRSRWSVEQSDLSRRSRKRKSSGSRSSSARSSPARIPARRLPRRFLRERPSRTFSISTASDTSSPNHFGASPRFAVDSTRSRMRSAHCPSAHWSGLRRSRTSSTNTARRGRSPRSNRTPGILRHAINWGRGRTPAIFTASPFHRFGVKIKTKVETKRDRRIAPDEERKLLEAADKLNCAEHAYAGPDARSACRRARNRLPARRDAKDPEPTRALGHTPDHHSGRTREGRRIAPHPVRTERTSRPATEATTIPRPEGLRLRHGDRRVPRDDPYGLGITRVVGARHRTDSDQGAWSREPRPARRNRSPLAQPPA